MITINNLDDMLQYYNANDNNVRFNGQIQNIYKING